MKTSGNTILITGGSEGIGLALTQSFLLHGNEVIICGRSQEKLDAVQQKLKAVHTIQCDVSDPQACAELYRQVTTDHPDVNILINNAGVERELDFTAPEIADQQVEKEVLTNVAAPVRLTALFAPYLQKQAREAAIINVSSGLAFVPLKIVPVYCATKAAIHSFTLSIRAQFQHSNVRVFEIIPPMVKTGLHKDERSKQLAEQRGVSATKVAHAAMIGIKRNRLEIHIHDTKSLEIASRIAPKLIRNLLNKVTS